MPYVKVTEREFAQFAFLSRPATPEIQIRTTENKLHLQSYHFPNLDLGYPSLCTRVSWFAPFD